MADLICRWRNGTPKNVMEVVNSMPHHEMPEWQFKNFMNKSVWGNSFSRTVYQFASQLALYYISDDGVYHPRFDHDINELEAKDYMERWLPRYYIPNPYVSSDGFDKIDCPTLFLKSLYDYVSKHPNCTYSEAYYECFHETAKNNDDIIRNYINNYSKVLIFHKDGMLSKTNANPHKIFRDMDRNDKKAFFDFFFDMNKEYIKNELNNSSYSNYFTATRTKPFLLLAGISGTGKSRIVRELAFMTCLEELQDEDGTTPGNYCMIEVKPNWHDSTELLGYYSSFNGGGYRFTKFDRFVVKAWLNPDVPFFVCLDEMNLAPVEQYFAEFLSVLETRSRDNEGNVVTGAIIDKKYFKDDTKMKEDLGLDGADDWTIKVRSDLVNKGLTLPPNLIIIGTVNMDDTTYQFSRKVIDRAMTIEMNGGELSQMFGNSNSLKYRSDEDIVKLGLFKAPYINAEEVIERYQSQANFIKEKLPKKLEAINTALKDTPFQVSYRVLNELVVYLGALMDEATAKGEAIDDDALPALMDQAMDQITLMKILPRIEGDEDMFRRSGGTNVLKTLQSLFSEDSDSYKKLREMIDRLERTGFTRFWP
jgi:hypothetical protein